MGNINPVPPFLLHLPIDERGYPIPYFVAIVDGKPDFRMLDQKKQVDCYQQHLCGVCGKALGKDSFYQICGPQGFKNRQTHEPFMHKDCALYSLYTCPHLHFQKAQRREVDDNRTITPNNMDLNKPTTMYLVKCRTAKFKTQEGVLNAFFKMSGYFKFEYDNGVLKSNQEFKKVWG